MAHWAKAVVRRSLASLGYEIRRVDRRIVLDSLEGIDLLYPLASQLSTRLGRGLRLLQVGANDGEREDPVRRLILTPGLIAEAGLVEPLPGAFAKLAALYQGDDRIQPINCAITAEPGTLPFYEVRGGDQVEALSVLASFDRAKVERTLGVLVPDPADRAAYQIAEIAVPCQSLGKTVSDLGWTGLDLLVTDAEGYDRTIVEAGFAEGLEPQLIYCEVNDLTPQAFQAFAETLKDRGYHLARTGRDLVAMKEGRGW